MQVTKGTWCMCEQCVPGSLSSSHAREPGNEANKVHERGINTDSRISDSLQPQILLMANPLFFCQNCSTRQPHVHHSCCDKPSDGKIVDLLFFLTLAVFYNVNMYYVSNIFVVAILAEQ